MSWINARRRRPAAGYAALLLGLVVVALVYGSLTSRGGVTEASAAVGAQQDVTVGKELFQANCSSCHGLDAQGTSQCPPMRARPRSTSRCPPAACRTRKSAENERGPVKFTRRQIAMTRYIDSLGGAPRFRPRGG